MGHTQFIPTSYLIYAIDADGDGKRDIWHSVPDALATAVEIRVHRKTKHGEQGEIAIAFGSLDELNGLLDKLGLSER